MVFYVLLYAVVLRFVREKNFGLILELFNLWPSIASFVKSVQGYKSDAGFLLSEGLYEIDVKMLSLLMSARSSVTHIVNVSTRRVEEDTQIGAKGYSPHRSKTEL